MSISLDNQTIDIPCPKCGKKIKERIGRLKRDPKLVCPCGQSIQIKADELRRATDTINKSLSKLGAALKKLK